MIPENPIETMVVYAAQSQYLKGPDPAVQEVGTVPLDTLPADWWNWLWQQVTKRVNEASRAVDSIHTEILSVLQEASITPTDVSTTDLLNAIKAITRTVGSGDIAGAVKSSTKSGYVAIDSGGYMSPNGMGIPTSLNTTAKQIVEAINEVLASLNTYKAATNDSITGLTNSKAPKMHASDTPIYGVGTDTQYGHVLLSDSTSSTSGAAAGIAATPAAVATVQAAVDDLSTALAIPAGVTVPYAGATSPTGWLLCNGQAVSRTSYSRLFAAIGTTYGSGDGSTTFNVPDLRECNPVGIGKRASGVTNHNELTLGGFQDDQYQQHSHGVTGNTGSTQPTFTGTAHSHSFTPSGSVASHNHSFTPEGTVSEHSHGLNNHTHSFSWSGSHSHSFCKYNYGSYDSSGKYIEVETKTSGTSSRGIKGTLCNSISRDGQELGITDATIEISGPTGGNSGNTTSAAPTFKGKTGGSTWVAPTFTGSGGTTSDATAGGSVSSHSHSLSLTTSGTGTSAGGTHGKLLGMNYIIKT